MNHQKMIEFPASHASTRNIIEGLEDINHKKMDENSETDFAYNPNVYHDYSMIKIVKNPENSISKPCATKEKNLSFPRKLHLILSNLKFQDIVTWLPNGCSWRVLDQKKFVEEVIPCYFRHRNFASFMRQVNGWGFCRINKGTDRSSYYHKVRKLS